MELFEIGIAKGERGQGYLFWINAIISTSINKKRISSCRYYFQLVQCKILKDQLKIK